MLSLARDDFELMTFQVQYFKKRGNQVNVEKYGHKLAVLSQVIAQLEQYVCPAQPEEGHQWENGTCEQCGLNKLEMVKIENLDRLSVDYLKVLPVVKIR